MKQSGKRCISVIRTNENNLKELSVEIPKDSLVVVTGVSGSGKSSLAFNTIYAEGQRRYMETFSAYARQFIGDMERPDVEKIEGLSPVISIEQKTIGKNPRSTVGTVTEIYDFLRLLYARIGEAYSYSTGKKMVKYTEQQIVEEIIAAYQDKKIVLLAPLVRSRKGHYRELFETVKKQGYTKVRVDGEVQDVLPGMQLDRYKTHDIEVVIDRLKVGDDRRDRIEQSLLLAMKMGGGLLFVMNYDTNEVRQFSKHLMCEDSGISYDVPSPNSFSFNSPYGLCTECNGLGAVNAVDLEKVIPDDNLTISDGGIKPLGEVRQNNNFKEVRALSDQFKFRFDTPIKDLPKEALNLLLNGGGLDFDVRVKHKIADFNTSLIGEGLVNMLQRYYAESTSEKLRTWAEEFMHIVDCPSCKGARLKKESLHFKIGGMNISEVARLDIVQLLDWLEELPDKLNDYQRTVGGEVLKELKLRTSFLKDVGLNYLTLNRPSRTLSGGESQRIRLASQIGSLLTGITYILDEPSIGLHQRDNERLIQSLKHLRDIGNSVIVVEHDKDIMLESDYIIDIGPGAGKYGGEIVAEGTPEEFLKSGSTTADFLSNQVMIEVPAVRRPLTGNKIVLKGCTGNNLKSVDLTVPLGQFICVSGVSGSGKSTLINETLYPILRKHLYNSTKKPAPYTSIEGIDLVDKVIDINQSPIGRTPRSNPATYTGVFTEIRKLFAKVPEAAIRGYKIGRFSFNVKGGRCETCKGGGEKLIEMNFLPDVYVDCDVCNGKRYNDETLEIYYKGKNISEVLSMTVNEAVEFFEPIPSIYRRVKTLKDVGLGYITLGQSAITLSGGEAQRVKLAEELAKKDTGNTLYILDEPTTGLHFSDIKQLLLILQDLVDKGNTVLVIEHNMDVIKVADYIIDVGPEGGSGGGQIVFQGLPEDLAKEKGSHTGRFLKTELMS